MKKILAVLAVLALLCAGVRAGAQDVGVGKATVVCGGAFTGAGGTVATLCTAVSGKVLKVKSVVVGAATDCDIQLYDGSNSAPIGPPIHVEGSAQSYVLGPEVFADVVVTASGNALKVGGTSGVAFSIGVRVEKE